MIAESSALETEKLFQGSLVHVLLGTRPSWEHKELGLPCFERWQQSTARRLIDKIFLYAALGDTGR